MIHVGVDRPQRFCYMTAVDATGRCLKSGAVPNQPEPLREWLRSLPAPREVAVKACSFWPTFQSAVYAEVRASRPDTAIAARSAGAGRRVLRWVMGETAGGFAWGGGRV
jgi:hypothetical protein